MMEERKQKVCRGLIISGFALILCVLAFAALPESVEEAKGKAEPALDSSVQASPPSFICPEENTRLVKLILDIQLGKNLDYYKWYFENCGA